MNKNNNVLDMESTEYLEGLLEISKQSEIESLKEDIPTFIELNKKLKNRKITLLLNLANDKACSYGELRNSMFMCYNIFCTANLM